VCPCCDAVVRHAEVFLDVDPEISLDCTNPGIFHMRLDLQDLNWPEFCSLVHVFCLLVLRGGPELKSTLLNHWSKLCNTCDHLVISPAVHRLLQFHVSGWPGPWPYGGDQLDVHAHDASAGGPSCVAPGSWLPMCARCVFVCGSPFFFGYPAGGRVVTSGGRRARARHPPLPGWEQRAYLGARGGAGRRAAVGGHPPRASHDALVRWATCLRSSHKDDVWRTSCGTTPRRVSRWPTERALAFGGEDGVGHASWLPPLYYTINGKTLWARVAWEQTRTALLVPVSLDARAQ